MTTLVRSGDASTVATRRNRRRRWLIQRTIRDDITKINRNERVHAEKTGSFELGCDTDSKESCRFIKDSSDSSNS
jgi:hypothetical protein